MFVLAAEATGTQNEDVTSVNCMVTRIGHPPPISANVSVATQSSANTAMSERATVSAVAARLYIDGALASMPS